MRLELGAELGVLEPVDGVCSRAFERVSSNAGALTHTVNKQPTSVRAQPLTDAVDAPALAAAVALALAALALAGRRRALALKV